MIYFLFLRDPIWIISIKGLLKHMILRGCRVIPRLFWVGEGGRGVVVFHDLSWFCMIAKFIRFVCPTDKSFP